MKYIPKYQTRTQTHGGRRGMWIGKIFAPYDPRLVIEFRRMGLITDKELEEYIGKVKARRLMKVTG
jgi:hypothetical protein